MSLTAHMTAEPVECPQEILTTPTFTLEIYRFKLKMRAHRLKMSGGVWRSARSPETSVLELEPPRRFDTETDRPLRISRLSHK